MHEPRKGPLRARQLTFEHLTREEEPLAQCGHKSLGLSYHHRRLLPALTEARYQDGGPFNRGFAAPHCPVQPKACLYRKPDDHQI
jgi:hypothetical protein